MALEEEARSCLLRVRHRLEEDIKPPYLMDHMISDGVMNMDEEEMIRSQVSQGEKYCTMEHSFIYLSSFSDMFPAQL